MSLELRRASLFLLKIMEKKVKIIANRLHVRMEPERKALVTSDVSKDEVYTITEVKNGYGLLKSKSGWIELKWCKEI